MLWQFALLPPVLAEVARITSVKGPLFIDELGRSRIFRGTNVVSKAFPYVPDTAVNADPKLSFNQKDVNLLASIGSTAIRLGVMWPGVEPTKGNYNQTYLDEIAKIVKMCSDAGIYVLLDFHQDVFSEQFCGEGVPSFVVKRESGPIAFPVPLSSPYSVDANGLPSYTDCKKFNWPLYHAATVVGKNYQRLYSNTDGVRDAFTEYWKVVAKTLLPYKNILGYDLINEPWSGDTTGNLGLLNPAVANSENLQPFYDAVAAGIRSVDPNALIHFESVTLIHDEVGFTKVPGGSEYAKKSVFNFHYYSDAQSKFDINATIGLRVNTAKALNCGAFLSEYEMGWGSGDRIPEIQNTLQSADFHLVSTTGWEYKAFRGIMTGFNAGLFEDDLSVRPQMATMFSRPHAHAVAGTPISMTYLDSSKLFVLEFNFNGQAGLAGTTEIVTNFGLHFPAGVQVKVLSSSGAFTTATSATDLATSKNSIFVTPDSKNMPTSGAGVVVAVFGTGSASPTLTVPAAIQSVTTSTVVANQKSSQYSMLSVGYVILISLVLLL
ncbi:glycoside hydrolase superfamily [Obelidium mucronatum]|nr:glycoside hydrolase superfamily [Obelidium mucronatum]